MKKKNMLVLATLVIFLVAIIFIIVKVKDKDDEISLEKNYGISHCRTRLTSKGIESSEPEDIVPKQDVLLERLKEKGYNIEYFDTVFDTYISCKRIYAVKGNKFIDICYDLTQENAEDAFYEFENNYETYYLMAMNGNYVY